MKGERKKEKGKRREERGEGNGSVYGFYGFDFGDCFFEGCFYTRFHSHKTHWATFTGAEEFHLNNHIVGDIYHLDIATILIEIGAYGVKRFLYLS